MERNEKIEILMAKVNVSKEEAIEALEKSNWDVLDAVLYLERKNSNQNSDVTTIIEVKAKEDGKKKEEFGGVGEIIGRVFKFAGKLLRKANCNYFEIRKEDRKPIRISITMGLLLLIFLSIPTIVLLILGLFGGYKYSITGNDFNYDGVNGVFDEISKSANDIKDDFKKGYNA